MHLLKTGGVSADFGRGWISTHTEALFHLKKVDAICFSHDPCLYNRDVYGNSYPHAPMSPLLQALYLQQLHYKNTGIILPLIEYSGRHNDIKLQKNPSEDEIKEWWLQSATITLDRGFSSLMLYIQKLKGSGDAYLDLLAASCFTQSIEQFKSACVYGVSIKVKSPEVPDELYPDELKREINIHIMRLRESYTKKVFSAIFEAIKTNPELILDRELSKLIQTKTLTHEENEILSQAIERIDIPVLIDKAMNERGYSAHSLGIEKSVNPQLNLEKYIDSFNSYELSRYIAVLLKTNNLERLALLKRIFVNSIDEADLKSNYGALNKLLSVSHIAWLLNDVSLLDRCKVIFIREKLHETGLQGIFLNVENFLPMLNEEDRTALKNHWLSILSMPASDKDMFSVSVGEFLKFFPDAINDVRLIGAIETQGNSEKDFLNLLINLENIRCYFNTVFSLEILYTSEKIAAMLIDRVLINFASLFVGCKFYFSSYDYLNSHKCESMLDRFPCYLKKLDAYNESYIPMFQDRINTILLSYYQILAEQVKEARAGGQRYLSATNISVMVSYLEITQKYSLRSPPLPLILFCINYLETKTALDLKEISQKKKLCAYRDSMDVGPAPAFARAGGVFFSPAKPAKEPIAPSEDPPSPK